MSSSRTGEPPRAGITDASAAPVEADEILIVRRGPGANCSSIGSTLDVLFVSATLAGVILASVAAALGDDEPRDENVDAHDRDHEGDDARAR